MGSTVPYITEVKVETVATASGDSSSSSNYANMTEDGQKLCVLPLFDEKRTS
jgi:hypothetical protein